MSVAPGKRHHVLLNSNEPPDEPEMNFSQSVMLKIDSSLTSLDDEIANLREKLAWLEEERTSLFSYWQRNNTIPSQLRRMPPELLRVNGDALHVGKFDMGQTLVDIDVFNEFSFVPMLLPVHQLTRHEDHLRILKQTPNLIEARLDIRFDEHPWPNSSETVGLLYLRRLYVSKSGTLKYFKAPVLQELALRYGGTDLLSPIHSLLDRSSCSLRRLCLRNPTAHITTKILQTFSSITNLTITNGKQLNALMATLTVTSLPGSPILASQLCLVFFGCESESRLDENAYLEMLKSRRAATDCALKSTALLLVDGPEPKSATRSGLETLRREGLDLWYWGETGRVMKYFVGITEHRGFESRLLLCLSRCIHCRRFVFLDSIFLFNPDGPHDVVTASPAQIQSCSTDT
ncbi:hypothetical protein B0H14DRAFT_2656799 [Mycena olivaceomarginata]|nr:hypothetical protein B0H14DRAFT_2656799 [Mycena olivaceomarginata]